MSVKILFLLQLTLFCVVYHMKISLRDTVATLNQFITSRYFIELDIYERYRAEEKCLAIDISIANLHKNNWAISAARSINARVREKDVYPIWVIQAEEHVRAREIFTICFRVSPRLVAGDRDCFPSRENVPKSSSVSKTRANYGRKITAYR